MSVKHHCIICGDLIYSGMYCSSCSREIGRARTLDEEALEEWVDRTRSYKIIAMDYARSCMILDRFSSLFSGDY